MSGSISNNPHASNIFKSFNAAQEKVSTAAQRMASGEKITKASDGAAQLSIGKGLSVESKVSKIALDNTAQAQAVLSVIDAGASKVMDLLTEMKELATTANAGSMSAAELEYTNGVFQEKYAELNRIADTTSFNNQPMLNGAIAAGSGVQTDTAGVVGGEKSQVAITMAAAGVNSVAGGLVVNGVTFNFVATASESLDNSGAIDLDQSKTAAQKAALIAGVINNTDINIDTGGGAGTVTNPQASMSQEARDRLSDLSATVNGNTVTISSRKAGGAAFTITAGGDANISDHITTLVSGSRTMTAAATASTITSSYASGVTTGSLGTMNMSVAGTVANNLVQTLSQTQASTGWQTVATADLADGTALNVFGRDFTIADNVTDSNRQIQRNTASNLSTLQNVARFLNNSDDANIKSFQFEARDNGGTLELRATARSASTFIDNALITIGTASGAGADGNIAVSSAGVANGLDVSHITDNASFLGKIGAFSAELNGSDNVKLSVKAGDYVYTGVVSDTTPSADMSVRMKSTDINGKGGWFDVVLESSGGGITVASQTDADTYADTLNSALGQLAFYQTREFNGFKTEGTSIEGTTANITSQSFDNVNIDKISAEYDKATAKGSLEISLQDGRIFTATLGGQSVGQASLTTLANKNDANETIVFAWGKSVDFSDATELAKLNSDLVAAFKSKSGGLDFQVGTKSDQVITVAVDDMRTSALFSGQVLDVSTKESAITAGSVLDTAINTLKTARASIGSLQSRFDAASSNIESTMLSLDKAREVFLGADVTEESTKLALAQAMLQASISVLSQMNQLPQNLLKLIG